MTEALELVGHIFNRFIIHFYAAAGVLLQAWFGMVLAKDWKRLPGRARRAAAFLAQHRVVLSIVLLIPLGVWEYTNLQHGQAYVKGFFDFASWPLGYAATLWVLKEWDRRK